MGGLCGPSPGSARRVPDVEAEEDLSRLAAVARLMTAMTQSTDQSAGASHPLEVGVLVDRCQSPESG